MAPADVLGDSVSPPEIPRPKTSTLQDQSSGTSQKNGWPAALRDETTHLCRRSYEHPPIQIVSGGKGHVLTMEDGHKVLDACGGAAIACIGQGNEEVIAAAVEQMRKINYANPSAYTTCAAEEFARTFLGGNKWGLEKMFVVGSGMCNYFLPPSKLQKEVLLIHIIITHTSRQ